MLDLEVSVDILRTIVWGIATKRSIQKAKPDPTVNFWRVIQGALFDDAVVKWCILFGSHDEKYQKYHWKNFFGAELFKAGLLSSLSISDVTWKKYWDEIKTYRDERAAHQSDEPSQAIYPDMSLALEAAYYYFDCIIPRLEEIGSRYSGLSLRDEFPRAKLEFDAVAAQAIRRSSGF